MVQQIVFVTTQLKIPLQREHTEKLQVETACRACQETGSSPQRDGVVLLSNPAGVMGMPRDEEDLCAEAQHASSFDLTHGLKHDKSKQLDVKLGLF